MTNIKIVRRFARGQYEEGTEPEVYDIYFDVGLFSPLVKKWMIDKSALTREEAINYLQQLYPNGGHCWLDEQRIEAISMAIDALKEPKKKCMYARDNYTDEDRKILCDGCEEECIEKINEERKRDLSLWSLEDFKNNFFDIIKPYKDSRNYKNLCIRLLVWRSELWRWIHWKKRKEETVSNDLNTELNKYIKENFTIDKEQLDRFGLEEKDYMYSMDKSDILILIRHFADWQKEQMMKDAIEIEVKEDAGGYPYIDKHIEFYDYDKDIPLAKAGDKVYVIKID